MLEFLQTTASVRIPELRSVPLPRRYVDIIDHPAFQRLRQVRQLGPTHFVYPGAVHTRFEHSLGVFDMARRYLEALLRDPNVAASVSEQDLQVCLLGALLHDLGHYPFAHSLEAVHVPGRDTPRHEDLTGRILLGAVPALVGDVSIGALIERNFGLDAHEVAALVTQKPRTHASPTRRLMATVISSGVDADKADYLERDSVHMGVPYGRQFDRARFLDCLCTTPDGDALAITDKGRVSAEIFVFCRYTMFSEAYWHHAVRSVSSMVEHALADHEARAALDPAARTAMLLRMSDDQFLEALAADAPAGTLTHRLLSALTGGRRQFYKRILTLNRGVDDAAIVTAYERVYRLDPTQLTALREQLCAALSRLTGTTVTLHDLLIDTPPRDKDHVESVQVVHGATGRALPLDRISRVVQGIGTDFIKVVKKIRVFVAPPVRDALDAAGLRAAASERLLETILAYHPEPDPQQRLL